MKRKFLNFALLFSLFITLLAVSAIAQNLHLMTVTVPFEFTVGKTTLPAGQYNVYRTSANTAEGFLLRGADTSTQVVFTTQPVQAGGLSSAIRLEFRRYGNQHFLAQIWADGSSIGHELAQSGAEVQAAKDAQQAPVQPGSKIQIVPGTEK